VHIKTSKGLDIPIAGKPEGPIQELEADGREVKAEKIALNFDPFDEIKPKLLVKVDDTVKIGQPLVADKDCMERVFVSPAAGRVIEIKRGLKRRLLNIVIKVDENEKYEEHQSLDPQTAGRDEIIERMKEGGLFAHFRQRPFNLLADPEKTPRAIFVKALESAPFTPPAEMQVEGHEEHFQTGLDALSKLTEGNVHLVFHKDSTLKAFTDAKNVQKHTAEGPHPISSPSLHIHSVSPVRSTEEVVWTANAHDVVLLGYLLNEGRYYTERVVSVAGPGVVPGRTGFFRTRAGVPVECLIAGRSKKEKMRFVSGDVLTGKKVDSDEFLEFYHYGLVLLPESTKREFVHFFRLGVNKYSNSRAYLSGHLKNSEREYEFTTSQHGEHRFFITPEPYEKVMPMNIDVMHLVKAVMAEDYDYAEELGFLEVVGEDFALPTFVCPSKMEMVDIVRKGLRNYSKEVLE